MNDGRTAMSNKPSIITKIKSSLHRKSLNRTIMIWFLLLSVLPMTLVAWISYQQAYISLTQNAKDKLELAANSQIAFFDNWFNYRAMDLHSQAENIYNAHLIVLLEEGFLQSGKSSEEYIKSYDWARRVDVAEDHLVTLAQHFDYIYDIFLIDTAGNVLYTVAREQDLGTNLFTGPHSDTRFARSVRSTLETGQSLFSDLEYYDVNDQITSFLTVPLLDEKGDIVGVYAIEARLETLFKNIASFNFLYRNNSQAHYLVGEDGYLRSAINQKNKDILVRKINTEPFQQWRQKNRGNMQSSQVIDHYVGPDGQEMIGLYQTVQLPGVKWLLVSEISQKEALADANWLGKITLILLLLTGLLVTILAIYQARRITQPISQLVSASKAVAAGESEQKVIVTADNEIGTLAKAFNHMLEVLNKHAKALETSHQQTEQALSDLAMQKFALDQHSIVAVTDVTGTITFVNDKFTEISGYNREELLGQNHRLLNSGHHDIDFFRELYCTITRGNVWNGEIQNKAKNGEFYWVDTTIVPFLDNTQNKPISYIALRTDITQRKHTETAMQEAKEAAELANQAKSMFLANMSHEIRTPMNGIIGMTGLLLDSDLDEIQRGRAITIRRSGESLLNIINDILDFSKIEAGRFDLEIIDFDLGELMEDFADTIALRAAEKGLELICPANPELHNWYKGDPGRIRQILTNLVGNAIKFTEQGEVSVRYSLESQRGNCNLLRFEVVDTGIGLDDEQEQKLFMRFSQADNSTTRQYGGTGLGLAISKQLTELMGGEIGFESKLSQGSNFWFTINLEIAEEQSTPLCTDGLQNQRILVVDDNNTNRELLDQILNVWGIEHGLAKDGPTALTVLKEAASADKPYHIVLLDMQMPGMDGAHIGTLILGNKQLTNTRLVMITSQGRQGDAKKMQKIGFTAYLCKPIRQSELFNALLQVAGVESNDANKRLITRYTSREQKQKQFVGRVLVVEDNITNQQVAQGMLEKLGLYVDVVANGQEAVQALEKLSYDIVFMDCQMPIMDGYTATKKIRSQPSLTHVRAVPIIGLTANAMRGDRDICLAAGMDDYISKPVDPSRLRQALARWLPDYHYQNKTQESINQSDTVNSCHSSNNNNTNETTPIELVFDYVALRSRLMDDETLMRTVAESFFIDMPKQIGQFELAVDADNIEKATAQAHKIKGGSANMGGMALSAFALQMEQAGKAGDLKVIREGSERMKQNFEQLKIAIEEKLF